MKTAPAVGEIEEADPGGEADGEAREHDARVLGIVDLGPVPHETGGAGDGESAGQAGSDDEHHQRADDRHHDLRLGHMREAGRSPGAARAEGEERPQRGGHHHAKERVKEVPE